MEGKVRGDHGIFLDPRLFSFAPPRFRKRLYLCTFPFTTQDTHPLAIGTYRDMVAFRLWGWHFDLLVERLDILGNGQALTLRQFWEACMFVSIQRIESTALVN